MAVLQAIILLLLLNVGICVYGAHFRGGTMSWKPTGHGNQVLVDYKMGFNGFRGDYPPGGHETCSQHAKDTKELLSTTGYLNCDGCQSFYYKPMEWICTDFDEIANWDIGGDSIVITVPNVNDKVVLYHEKCCWVGPLKNAPQYHPNQGYKMLTEIDLRPRPDNGEINSSPITNPIPVQLFHSGCSYHLEIPVTDPDNDPYRCRYTSGWNEECYDYSSGKYGDICDGLSYITVYDNCTLEFDTSGGQGYYAVRVMIEDLDQNGDPLSKISLSFLLEVSEDDSTCKTPRIVAPLGGCKTIPVGQLYQENIVAEGASEELPVQRIETSKPPGMNMTEVQSVPGYPLRKSMGVSWTPTNDQKGKHALGYNAVDSKGFVSGWTFMYLNVAEADLLYPIPEESTPSEGEEISTTAKWVVRFNKEIQRPSQSAYITLLDNMGNVSDRLDASQEEQVSFSDRDITFYVSLSNPHFGNEEFQLILDVGVAVNAFEGDCFVHSNPAEWNVFIKGAEKPATNPPPPTNPPLTTTLAPATTPSPVTTPPPATTPLNLPQQANAPIFQCRPGNVDITPPSGTVDGDECFIHLEQSHVTVAQNIVSVPYKLCCQGVCIDPVISSDNQPLTRMGPPGCV